ncbi:MAG: hypothetical protein AMR96_05940 [Candidatus Adiutrix intracellularis]|nr:MAG: hypothetical protein AMR96_05940 [Candidatus Adiutrix intracellularis]
MTNPDRQNAARIVAGTLTLLSRELHEAGHPADLWTPKLWPEYIRETAARVSQGEATVLWAERSHPARGLVIYEASPEESTFFGFSCARLWGPYLMVKEQRDREIRVRKLARLAINLFQTRDDHFLTLKTSHDPASLRGFLAEGFILAEIGATLISPVPKIPGAAEDRLPNFIFLEQTKASKLASNLVAELGIFFYDGHLRHDSEVGPEAADRFWSARLAGDLAGAAQETIILWDRPKDRVAGLATARLNKQGARTFDSSRD